MLKEAYCQALSACITQINQAKGKSARVATDGRLEPVVSRIPLNIIPSIPSGVISYNCLSALGCDDEENPNASR
jgi:hypothetical protein